MFLPKPVAFCIDTLESAGYAAYAVGGCVRDSLLGLTPHDYDLCTAATPAEISEIFRQFPLVKAGEKHGTIGVVMDGQVYEITTFRTEGDYIDSRHPGWVSFVPEIGQDLARRDFTVNAMAYSPSRGFADPFGGREDLNRGVLRAVGEPSQRFTEDALRILRGVRFAVRFGLQPEKKTMDAMVCLAAGLDHIAAERIFDELCKLLPMVKAEDLLAFAPILCRVIPELEPMLGFDQRNRHHAFDAYTHTAYVTQAVPPTLSLRWAALLHDVGKVQTFTVDEKGQGHFYGHAEESAKMANAILRRLKAPNALREEVAMLIDRHMLLLLPDKKMVRRHLGRLGEDAMEKLLQLQEADLWGTGTRAPEDLEHFRQLRRLMEEIRAENACLSLKDLAVNGRDLMALGYEGPAIGKMLNHLLEQVLEENLPNEKTDLLNAAKQ